MSQLQPPPGAWDTPVEVMLTRYLDTLDRADRETLEARLIAAIRAEPIARGCPSLAMLRPADLSGVRSHLELIGTLQGDLDAEAIRQVLVALNDFLDWAREVGAHELSAEVVAGALGLSGT